MSAHCKVNAFPSACSRQHATTLSPMITVVTIGNRNGYRETSPRGIMGHSEVRLGTPMATGKTSTLTCRIEPALKEALRTAADREHRSIANMVGV
jgi:hypothetical protein